MNFIKEEIISELTKLGWIQYLGDIFHWQNMNRYVDYEFTYVDIYAYQEEEKYCSYLTTKEFNLFNKLFLLI